MEIHFQFPTTTCNQIAPKSSYWYHIFLFAFLWKRIMIATEVICQWYTTLALFLSLSFTRDDFYWSIPNLDPHCKTTKYWHAATLNDTHKKKNFVSDACDTGHGFTFQALTCLCYINLDNINSYELQLTITT